MYSTTGRTGRRGVLSAIAIALVAMAGILVSGCGSSSSSTKNGGTVTIMEVAGGVDNLDPGYWYYHTTLAVWVDAFRQSPSA